VGYILLDKSFSFDIIIYKFRSLYVLLHFLHPVTFAFTYTPILPISSYR